MTHDTIISALLALAAYATASKQPPVKSVKETKLKSGT